jgi:hypothetical protein
MSYRGTFIGFVTRFEPERAREAILKAYETAKGNAVAAATILDVSHRSLLRFVNVLELQVQIDKVRVDNHHPWRGHK